MTWQPRPWLTGVYTGMNVQHHPSSGHPSAPRSSSRGSLQNPGGLLVLPLLCAEGGWCSCGCSHYPHWPKSRELVQHTAAQSLRAQIAHLQGIQRNAWLGTPSPLLAPRYTRWLAALLLLILAHSKGCFSLWHSKARFKNYKQARQQQTPTDSNHVCPSSCSYTILTRKAEVQVYDVRLCLP